MKVLIAFLLVSSLLYGDESCEDKRKRLTELQTRMEAENVGKVLALLTLTKPTSTDRHRLEQQIRILRMELEQCSRQTADKN